uniref:DUF1499 domain-containing protein n=1 Tax=Odontella aurita TaxID=265563 RepID=A0A7S4JSI4_9STRA|mmetsp:Transcript_52391/g.157216  ORF Transcript_52391/g.157216 Transcript_52391/m.157216 type:complete len:215 (+) Transcript_52391:63-707(+)
MRYVVLALVISLCGCVHLASGYNHSGNRCLRAESLSSSRRGLLRNIGAAFVGASSVYIASAGDEALALEACRANSRNCIRTVWKPPSGKSKSEAVKDIRDVIASYPQGGQSGVDCSGWLMAKDDLDEKASARVEYKSCIGPAAVSMNLGRPFTDDLKLEMGDDGTLEVRSNSRVGGSDFGVNKKRVNYLAAALRSKGWDAPKVSYGIASYDSIF